MQIPSALNDAIRIVIAEQRREWSRDRERIEADARAATAETRAEFAEFLGDLRAANASFRDTVNVELAQIRQLAAELKDGAPGQEGQPGKDADEDAIVERLRALIPAPVAGEPGRDGKDAEIDREYINNTIYDAVRALMPPPEPGQPGMDGQPGDPTVLLPMIEQMLDERVAAIVPVPGKQGPPGEQGAPGVVDMDAIAARVLDAIPPPADGAPGKDGRSVVSMRRVGGDLVVAMNDGELMTFGDIRGPEGPQGRPGIQGQDGKSVELAIVKELVDEEVTRAVAALPPPEKGERGDRGEDVDLDAVSALVENSVRRTLADWPQPQDGRDGAPGKDAEVDYERIQEAIDAAAAREVEKEVVKQLAELPPPEPGPRGPPGEPGPAGRDGADITDGFKTHDGHAVLTKSDGGIVDLGVVQGRDGAPGADGKDGKDGRDGKDGLSFDAFEFDVEYDGERNTTLKWRDGKGNEVDRELIHPVPLHRGIFNPDVEYAALDIVTHQGCQWLAKTNTKQKPELFKTERHEDSDWRLIVKRGRDGRDGKSAYDVAVDNGFKGSEADWFKSLKGPPGPPGKDLTHLMPGDRS